MSLKSHSQYIWLCSCLLTVFWTQQTSTESWQVITRLPLFHLALRGGYSSISIDDDFELGGRKRFSHRKDHASSGRKSERFGARDDRSSNRPRDGGGDSKRQHRPGDRNGRQSRDGKDGKDGDRFARLKKRPKFQPNIVFVGQLPYSTTKEQLQALFERRGLTEMKVRILTDKKTKASRGIAFVEFKNEEDAAKALTMDHSLMGGRRIRIERTAAGGGNKEKRKARVAHAKKEQEGKRRKEVMEMLTQVFVTNRQKQLTPGELADLAQDPGLHESRRPPSVRGAASGDILRLEMADMDEKIINFLCTLPIQVARRAVMAAARADMRGVENKPAWVMGMFKKRLRRAEKIAKKKRHRSSGAVQGGAVREIGDTGLSESMSEGVSLPDDQDDD